MVFQNEKPSDKPLIVQIFLDLEKAVKKGKNGEQIVNQAMDKLNTYLAENPNLYRIFREAGIRYLSENAQRLAKEERPAQSLMKERVPTPDDIMDRITAMEAGKSPAKIIERLLDGIMDVNEMAIGNKYIIAPKDVIAAQAMNSFSEYLNSVASDYNGPAFAELKQTIAGLAETMGRIIREQKVRDDEEARAKVEAGKVTGRGRKTLGKMSRAKL